MKKVPFILMKIHCHYIIIRFHIIHLPLIFVFHFDQHLFLIKSILIIFQIIYLYM